MCIADDAHMASMGHTESAFWETHYMVDVLSWAFSEKKLIVDTREIDRVQAQTSRKG
jgi:hypothetical protein